MLDPRGHQKRFQSYFFDPTPVVLSHEVNALIPKAGRLQQATPIALYPYARIIRYLLMENTTVHFHEAEVAGSKPASPTNKKLIFQKNCVTKIRAGPLYRNRTARRLSAQV
jgi:hypothetical protein